MLVDRSVGIPRPRPSLPGTACAMLRPAMTFGADADAGANWMPAPMLSRKQATSPADPRRWHASASNPAGAGAARPSGTASVPNPAASVPPAERGSPAGRDNPDPPLRGSTDELHRPDSLAGVQRVAGRWNRHRSAAASRVLRRIDRAAADRRRCSVTRAARRLSVVAAVGRGGGRRACRTPRRSRHRWCPAPGMPEPPPSPAGAPGRVRWFGVSRRS